MLGVKISNLRKKISFHYFITFSFFYVIKRFRPDMSSLVWLKFVF